MKTEDFGVEVDGMYRHEVDGMYRHDDDVDILNPKTSSVVVPKVANPLSGSDYETLQAKFNPLEHESSCYGIYLYENVLKHVYSKL